MMYCGLLLAMRGFKDGTAVFGYPLLILSVLDAWLPLVHQGYWGLIGGVFVAVGNVTGDSHLEIITGSEHCRVLLDVLPPYAEFLRAREREAEALELEARLAERVPTAA